MRLDEETRLVHEPARLRIMALLYQRGEVGAAAARQTLGLTPGNLDAHARRLCDAGLTEARKALARDGFEARYRITRRGAEAFERYLQALEEFVAASGPSRQRPPGPAAPA